MIYVPQYDPEVVYVQLYYEDVGTLLTFSAGFAVGSWLNYERLGPPPYLFWSVAPGMEPKLGSGDRAAGMKVNWDRGDYDQNWDHWDQEAETGIAAAEARTTVS